MEAFCLGAACERKVVASTAVHAPGMASRGRGNGESALFVWSERKAWGRGVIEAVGDVSEFASTLPPPDLPLACARPRRLTEGERHRRGVVTLGGSCGRVSVEKSRNEVQALRTRNKRDWHLREINGVDSEDLGGLHAPAALAEAEEETAEEAAVDSGT